MKMLTTLVLNSITAYSATPSNALSANKATSKNTYPETVFYPPTTVPKVVLSAPLINALLVKLDTQHNRGRFA